MDPAGGMITLFEYLCREAEKKTRLHENAQRVEETEWFESVECQWTIRSLSNGHHIWLDTGFPGGEDGVGSPNPLSSCYPLALWWSSTYLSLSSCHLQGTGCHPVLLLLRWLTMHPILLQFWFLFICIFSFSTCSWLSSSCSLYL